MTCAGPNGEFNEKRPEDSAPTNSSVPIPPEPQDSSEQPAPPRRGSKRSLVSRSRQGSRSSRRSLRHGTRAQESKELPPPLPSSHSNANQSTKKPKSGGFLSFLNCCRGDDGLDDLKEEADVPAKQRKIEPTPQSQRLPVPSESAVPNESEKSKTEADQPVWNEKVESKQDQPTDTDKLSRDELRPKPTRRDVSQESPTRPSGSGPVVDLPDRKSSQRFDRDPTTTLPAEESSKQAGLPAQEIAATAAVGAGSAAIVAAHESKPQLQFDPPPRDVPMPDAPTSIPPVDQQNRYDEPEQPQDAQPTVPLPPPPPMPKQDPTVPATVVPPVPEVEPGRQQWLLPAAQPPLKGRKCLILDLDETLVHSSFKILNQADFTIPVEIEGQYHNVYVIKRPGVDQFMKRVGELYEVVVFTASVSKYGDPLLDQLDIHHVVHHRLFRESCYNHQGNYVKV